MCASPGYSPDRAPTSGHERCAAEALPVRGRISQPLVWSIRARCTLVRLDTGLGPIMYVARSDQAVASFTIERQTPPSRHGRPARLDRRRRAPPFARN